MLTAVEEMSLYVRAAAEPWAPGESVKAGMSRAARRMPFLSHRRISTLWYANQCRVLAEEIDAARAWYRDHCDGEAARLEARAAELRERANALGKYRDEMRMVGGSQPTRPGG